MDSTSSIFTLVAKLCVKYLNPFRMMEKCLLTIFKIFVPRVGFDPRTPGFESKYFEEMGEHVYLLGIASKEIWKVKEMSFRH